MALSAHFFFSLRFYFFVCAFVKAGKPVRGGAEMKVCSLRAVCLAVITELVEMLLELLFPKHFCISLSKGYLWRAAHVISDRTLHYIKSNRSGEQSGVARARLNTFSCNEMLWGFQGCHSSLEVGVRIWMLVPAGGFAGSPQPCPKHELVDKPFCCRGFSQKVSEQLEWQLTHRTDSLLQGSSAPWSPSSVVILAVFSASLLLPLLVVDLQGVLTSKHGSSLATRGCAQGTRVGVCCWEWPLLSLPILDLGSSGSTLSRSCTGEKQSNRPSFKVLPSQVLENA